MELTFKTKQLRDIVESAARNRAAFGASRSKRFLARISQLEAAETLNDLPPPPPELQEDELIISAGQGIWMHAISGHSNELNPPTLAEWQTMQRLHITKIRRGEDE